MIVSHTDGDSRAEAVIVTVPLGVLKARMIGFEPVLPRSKMDTIARLGMGHLSKVYLRFEEVFWDPDVELFGFMGDERGEFPLWLNMAFYTGEPILMAFQAGSRADAASEWSDERTVAEAVSALRRMSGAS